MPEAAAFFFAHPLWVWLAVGAILLALEAATGSGWLLWPSGSALLTGVATLVIPLTTAEAVAIFAVLTIISTFLGRRYLRGPARGADINDSLTRLIGRRGEAACAFQSGLGRVFVDGKEWSAELESDAALTAGDKVEVVAVLGGARLKVKPA